MKAGGIDGLCEFGLGLGPLGGVISAQHDLAPTVGCKELVLLE